MRRNSHIRNTRKTVVTTNRSRPKRPPMDPALRATLIFLGPSALIRILSALLGYAWVGGLIQLFLYIFCGYTAGKWYYETIRRIYPQGRPTESLRKGAAAGIALGILLTVILVILIMIAGVTVASLPFLAEGAVLLCWVPFDILAGLFLGALGGKISAKIWR